MLPVHCSLPDYDPYHVVDLTPKFFATMESAGIDFQTIIVLRNPVASVASAHRRGFHQVDSGPDVLYQARMTEKNLLLLTSQLSVLDRRKFIVLSYEDLNSTVKETKSKQCRKLAPFLGITMDECMSEVSEPGC